MKILGVGCYVILITNKIQPLEYSKGGEIGGILYKTDSDGNPNIFNVEHDDDGKRWLNGNWDNPDNFWNADNLWVFARRNLFRFSP